MPKFQFARLDDQPVVYTDTRAWQHKNGEWREVHLADVHHDARTLSRAEFYALFGETVHSLPTMARHSSESPAATSA